MFEMGQQTAFYIFLTGLLVSLSLWIKALFHRISLPPLIGLVALGWVCSALDRQWELLPENAPAILNFLSEAGIIVLLFRIGFKSRIKALEKQMSRASLLALSNIALSAVLGFCTAYYLLGVAFISSLFIGIALTATSIGITVTIWKEHRILKTREGDLLLDLVALDDLIAIVLMGVLFNLAPLLLGEENTLIGPGAVAFSALWIIAKFALFILLCYLFSHFAEAPLTRYLLKREPKPDPIITIAGVGFVIAGLAAFLGFSPALGAFFAGIAFSRDKIVEKSESSLQPIEEFFVPFFFIVIGFKLAIDAPLLIAGLASLLFIAAVAGKVLGIYLPARVVGMGGASGMILGISMIPRAEVAMIIMDHGLMLGEWAVPQTLYAAVVLVCLAASVVAPLLLHPLLKNFPLPNRS